MSGGVPAGELREQIADLIASVADAVHSRADLLAVAGEILDHFPDAGKMMPAGWVLVPVEPTGAMVDRFVSRALCVSVHGDGGWSEYARQQWATMLSAVPTPTPPIEGRDADVERVARSLSENLYAFGDENISDCGEWEDMSDGAREVYRIAARAALQALGERG